MATQSKVQTAAADADGAIKAGHRAMWALGDYHRFATSTVWELGPVLVEACGITAGQRVLDVAAGTGNTAIRAAQRGARVVASDLTPEHFEAGSPGGPAEGGRLGGGGGGGAGLPPCRRGIAGLRGA